jgi:zinc protease
VLREDLGGTYGVQVGGGLSRRPVEYYRTDVNFSCSPDNVAKLTDAVYSEVRAAKDKGLGDDYLNKVKAAQKRALEEAVRSNGYWLGRLSEHWTYGTDPKLILEEPKLVDLVDGAALKAAAARYFDEKRQIKGILRPASGVAPASPAPSAPPRPGARAPARQDQAPAATL